MRVFVSNISDALMGRWVNVTEECESAEEFTELCKDIALSFGSEEYMFPTTEPVVNAGNNCEYCSASEIWEIAEAMDRAELDSLEDAFLRYIEIFDNIDYDAFLDSYMGEFDDGAEYAEQITTDCGSLENVPEFVKYHIDWEAVWDCELSFDYSTADAPDGGIFIYRNC